MPYPDLPPDLPPRLETPACEARCPTPSPAHLPRSLVPGSSQPSLPERFAPESLPVTVSEFSSRAGTSRADLLTQSSASEKADSITSQEFQSPSPSPQPALPSAQAVSRSQPPTSSTQYAIEGASSKLPDAQETNLMRELQRSLDLSGLQPKTDSLNLSVIDRAGRSTINHFAQSNDRDPSIPTTDPAVPVLIPTPNDTTPNPFPPAQTPATPNQTPSQAPNSAPNPAPNPAPSQTPNPIPSQTPNAPVPPGTVGVVEVSGDRQEFDNQHQTFTAEGNVRLRFQGGLLDADRVQVNLLNRLVVAEGRVALTRGNQVLRGQRFEYNLVQNSGTVRRARGELFLPTTATDFVFPTEAGINSETTLGRPLSDRVRVNQPIQGVSSPGGFSTSVGAGRDVNRVPGALRRGGEVRRLRFEAEEIDFTADGFQARKIDITNDPFSPPELVLRADRATLTRLAPLRDELRATNARLVFDQRLTIPILLSRLVLDRTERQPPLARIAYDFDERGGVFVEREFQILRSPAVSLTLTPQFLAQRAFTGGNGIFSPSSFGVRTRLNAILGPQTTIRGLISLPTFDLNEFGDRVRASLRAQQLIGSHTLALEYSYRDRLFNGSLGFQTVQSSLGIVLVSPVITLGRSGAYLTYQAGYQYINSDTDRQDLLDTIRKNNRINLSRFQATAEVGRGFLLWAGKPLPPTPTQGLRYTPNPVQPFIILTTAVRGVISAYSSSDVQRDLIGRVELLAQFGNFSRPVLDFTAVRISYSQTIGAGQSPFFFDRSVDNRVLTLGLTQQIYGPFRFTLQTSLSLDNNTTISTDYILEYSRRTYGVIVRYNPTLSIASLNLRISDFNYSGGTEPFAGTDVIPVENGVIQNQP